MQGMEEGSLGDTLRKIVDMTLPSPRYSRYHEAHLQRYLSQLGAHPPQYAPVPARLAEGLAVLLQGVLGP